MIITTVTVNQNIRFDYNLEILNRYGTEINLEDILIQESPSGLASDINNCA
ncbi:MAG: hypothetical protein AAGF83_26165 [Cyanobacteria bacterium P01_G01_bin.67]